MADRHGEAGSARPAGGATETLPLGSVAYEAERTDRGEVLIWVEENWLNKLRATRGPGFKPPDDWYWVAFRRKAVWGLGYERGSGAPLAKAGFIATL